MAETKSKKQPAKIIDVARPGKSAPDTTARPVIISNRSVLKDPMMVQDATSEDDVADGAPQKSDKIVSHVSHSLKLQPLHVELSDTFVPGAPAVKGDEAAKEEDEKPEKPEKPAPTIAELAAAAKTREKSAAKTEGDTPGDEPDEAPTEAEVPAKPVKTHDAAESRLEAPADNPTAEPVDVVHVATHEKKIQPLTLGTDVPKNDEADHTSGDSSESRIAPAEKPAASAETEEAAAPETPADEPLLGDSTVTPPSDDAADATLSEAAKKAAAAAKKQAEEQEKIIASGKYYLPINAVEKRRTKRHIALGLALIILLAVALFLAAWDANFFAVPGFAAPTNYL